MTYVEYRRKRTAIAVSEAPLDQRAAAIEELDEKFGNSAVKRAKQQMEESLPDTSDIGGQDDL